MARKITRKQAFQGALNGAQQFYTDLLAAKQQAQAAAAMKAKNAPEVAAGTVLVETRQVANREVINRKTGKTFAPTFRVIRRVTLDPTHGMGARQKAQFLAERERLQQIAAE